MPINRVYIRKQDALGKPDKDGFYTDHYTGKKVHESEVQRGHTMYLEHRYLKDAAEHMNMTQSEFGKMNRSSNLLVPQSKESNSSHYFECNDKMVGYNTSLHHIGEYMKYGKSEEEKAKIDKQLINARKEKLKEMKNANQFSSKYDPNKTNIKSTARESLLLSSDRLNYEKLDKQIAKDKAKSERLTKSSSSDVYSKSSGSHTASKSTSSLSGARTGSSSSKSTSYSSGRSGSSGSSVTRTGSSSSKSTSYSSGRSGSAGSSGTKSGSSGHSK